MKHVLILCFLITSLTATHSSQIDPNDVFSEIEAYGRLRTVSLRMMRAGTNQARCYETYIPKITELAERGKNESETCIANADSERAAELEKVQEQRLVLEERVDAIRKSLNACTAEEDVIKYLNCLRNGAEENRATLTEIEETSTSLHDQLQDAYKQIQQVEHGCIRSVIKKAKEDTDDVFDALQDCLIHGFKEPQPETTEEPQTETTEEAKPDPTEEPQATPPAPETNPNEDIN